MNKKDIIISLIISLTIIIFLFICIILMCSIKNLAWYNILVIVIDILSIQWQTINIWECVSSLMEGNYNERK